MARPAKAPKDDVQELKTPDYDGAIRTYKQDILPAQGKVGEFAQEMSTAYKHIKKNCRIPGWVAKLAFRLDDTEESKRDVELRALSGLLGAMGIGISRNLLDEADGTATPEVIPTASARPRPALVTVD